MRPLHAERISRVEGDGAGSAGVTHNLVKGGRCGGATCHAGGAIVLVIVNVTVSALRSATAFLSVEAYSAIALRLQATGIGAPRAGSSPEKVEL